MRTPRHPGAPWKGAAAHLVPRESLDEEGTWQGGETRLVVAKPIPTEQTGSLGCLQARRWWGSAPGLPLPFMGLGLNLEEVLTGARMTAASGASRSPVCTVNAWREKQRAVPRMGPTGLGEGLPWPVSPGLCSRPFRATQAYTTSSSSLPFIHFFFFFF